VDQDFSKQLISLNGQYYFEPQAFEKEHSLEVEIPFLQKIFSNFKIVPVIMGQPNFETLNSFASDLNKLIGAREDVLIVVSTDLSHFHDDAFARKIDQKSIGAVKELNAQKLWKGCHLKVMEMCGCVPVTTAILYAKQKGLKNIDVLKVANSGDISGDKERVVGYTSIVIYNDEKAQEQQEVSSFTIEQKKRLLDIARNSIEQYVNAGKYYTFENTDARLSLQEGAFVTIHIDGRLRGCIGNIIGKGPLFMTVRNMAISAASQDARFKPVKKGRA